LKTALLELRRATRSAVVSLMETISPPKVDGLPLPPPKLRDKVVKGLVTADEFLTEGAAVADAIRAILAESGVPLAPGQAVYEWGCGCGRVARHLIPLGLDVHGSDVDPELVDWCRQHIDAERYFVNDYEPPTRLMAGSFDVSYCISVMTHITMEAADAWIRELARVTKPGGAIVISLLAKPLSSGVEIHERLDTGIKRSWLGSGGAPAAYLDTWHDIEWLAARWSGVVKLEARKPKAIRGRQDLLLFRPA
jgi:SAM-dependent methyltransferase